MSPRLLSRPTVALVALVAAAGLALADIGDVPGQPDPMAPPVLTNVIETPNMTAPAPSPGTSSGPVDGQQLYLLNCSSCHEEDGSGVFRLQPALRGDEVVRGKAQRMLNVILRGGPAALPPDRLHYINTMPSFASRLTDEQIAAIATYVRHEFGHGASAVTPEDVAAVRAAK